MLRPAVAIANNARAGKTRGLDIGRRRPSLKKDTRCGHAGRDRSPKVPKRGEAVNEGAKTALSGGTGTGFRGYERLRVPDAVQRSSRCSAEPGPTRTAELMGPGSAAHRHSASKTRVNALKALRSIQGTSAGSGVRGIFLAGIGENPRQNRVVSPYS